MMIDPTVWLVSIIGTVCIGFGTLLILSMINKMVHKTWGVTATWEIYAVTIGVMIIYFINILSSVR